MSSKRDSRIDIVRAFAIIMVIVGHGIFRAYPGRGTASILYNAIVAFNMPLFFFLSGTLLKDGGGGLRSIRQRFERLVIPYLAWTFLKRPLGAAVLPWMLGSMLAPGYTYLWFFPALFYAHALFVALPKRRLAWLLGSAGVVYVALAVLEKSGLVSATMLSLHFLVWLFPYYVAGYLARERKEWMYRVPIWASVPVFAGTLALIWPVLGAEPRLLTAVLAASPASPALAVLAEVAFALLGWACAFAGIAIAYRAAGEIGRSPAMQSIGRRTFGIYASTTGFPTLTFGGPVIAAGLFTGWALGFGWLVAGAIERSRVLSPLLMGTRAVKPMPISLAAEAIGATVLLLVPYLYGVYELGVPRWIMTGAVFAIVWMIVLVVSERAPARRS